MKAPMTMSKFGNYALTSALFVFAYSMLGHLIETLHSPKTIKQALVLYVFHLSLMVVIHLYRNRRKKSSAQPEVR